MGGLFLVQPGNSDKWIARGDELGDTAVAHLEFIVRTVRDHLLAKSCRHTVAHAFCADCGTRMSDAPGSDRR